MTLLVIAGTSFLLGLSGAMMPGPLLSMTISESARRGFSAGPLLILGHALLEAGLVLLLCFGLDEYICNPLIFSVLAITGGMMLLWMGRGMIKGLSSLTLDLSTPNAKSLNPVVAGIAISIANPYFTLWWATAGLGYLVLAHESGHIGIVIFYLFHVFSDFVWYSLISGAVTFGRRFINDRIYRFLVGGCAVFIILFGFYFSFRGIEKIATLS